MFVFDLTILKGINNFSKRAIYDKLYIYVSYPKHYQGKVYMSFMIKIV